MFKPSINWGNQLGESVWWIIEAWAISAACVLVLALLLIRYVGWAKRFWRVTGAYFAGRDSWPVWGMLAVLLLSVILEVRIAVLLSYYNNDLFSALQVAFHGAGAHNLAERNSGVHGFWVAIVIFCILAAIHIARIVFDTYLTQRFIIRWRVWLTHRLTADWLTGRAYYRSRFVEPTVDNPDQRIQQDIDVFTTGVGTGPNVPTYYSQSMLLFGAISSVASVASFAVILWRLSGTLTVFGVDIPKALFWVVIAAYVLLASVIAFRIGHPLIRLSFRNEQTNAAFRYALVRLRDAAEAVGFYRGERTELKLLEHRFSAVISNYRSYVRRTLGLIGWNYSVTETILPLPYVLQAPRLFAGTIKLGDVTQSAGAFGKIESGLSFFRNAYSQFASYEAAIVRLDGLIEANERARQLPVLATEVDPDGAVELVGVEVFTPTGELLVSALDVRLERGDSLAITGPSGSGKTTLLRSLAGLWPTAAGRWRSPADQVTMFLSQLPYLPLGDLRTAVSYPAQTRDIPDEALRDALTRVSLAHLRDRLDDEADWAKVLSPGEQQRVAFARVLLTRPEAVFLDEATSALDEGVAFALYEELRIELPDSVFVMVTHQRALVARNRKQLELLGSGLWRLGSVPV
jgi:putative ATP-binding cassette transporter